MPDVFNDANRDLIITLAARSGVPAIYPRPVFAESGGLIAYGADRKRSVRRSSEDDVDLLIPIRTCDAPEVLGGLWRLFLLRSTSPWRDGG
jgi:hypothetical protein